MMNDRNLGKFYYSSPLGEMVLCGYKSALCGLWFVGQKHIPNELEALELVREDNVFVETTIRWLDAYFAHRPLPDFPKFCLEGTSFQKAVWGVLEGLPYGTRVSYSDVAILVAKVTERHSVAVRAVASAIGRNPISILIPCHRVLGKDGALRGYAGGLERKQWLLEWER